VSNRDVRVETCPKMEAMIRERGLPWPQFRDNEVRALVAYLRSAAAQSEQTAAQLP
jgi:cytochrome c1